MANELIHGYSALMGHSLVFHMLDIVFLLFSTYYFSYFLFDKCVISVFLGLIITFGFSW